MIMSMYKIIAFSNRKLCSGSLLDQIDIIAQKKKPDIFVLREKDMGEKEYEALAKEVIKKCEKYGIECILHNFIDAAINLNYKKIHLPLSVLKEEGSRLKDFEIIGASTHSKEDAILAESLGASYVTAGHVFKTDCKKGLEPRGLGFLKDVCKTVDIPVFAIGGINESNMEEAVKAGANGVCLMSGFMKIK